MSNVITGGEWSKDTWLEKTEEEEPMPKGWHAVEDKVLIKMKEVQEQTKGGIFLPETAKEKEENQTDEGEIVNIGGNCFEGWEPPIPKVGDWVLFSRYAGRPLKIDGVKHRIMKDMEIGMVMVKEEEDA